MYTDCYSALEENSADVQAESKEQLTRMQRVVDAWQSQANTSQQELVATMQKMEELRNKVNKLTTEVHNLQDSNNSLSEELTERNQEIAVHTAKEKSLQNELDVKSKVLKNVHEQQSAIENELKQLKTKNNSSASLAQEMTEKNKHLAEELNALRLKCESMENSYKTQFSELKNKQMATNSDLSNKLSNMEQKSSIAIQNYAQKLSDSEAALSQAEKYNAACTSELNELKSKFAEIQNKTENVIRQKDMVVKGLHATNKQNQLEFDELKEKNKENEIQIQKLVNNTSDLKNQLLEKDKELLAKSELFLNQLEKRANEFKATQLKHKAALELLKEQHEAQLNEVSAKNGIQMALKIDELKLLANKQESEVSRECQEKHSDEIAKLKLEHDASLKAVEETLRLKMEEKLSKLRASMAEAHAIELDTLRQDLMLTNSSDIHTKITQVEHQYSNLINEAQSKVEVMQQEHQLEISNLKSAHSTEISVLQSENNKEKEHALNGLIEKHNQALLEQTNEFQKQSKQTEEEHRSAIEALQQKHAASLKKAISTTKSKIEDFYKKKIEDTNSKHEDAYRELQSALMDTQSKLQDELQIALQSQENNLKQQSSEQVHELKQELINQQQKHSDSLYALEARHAEALGSATRTLRESLLQEHEVECTMLKKRHEEELENALNALRLELEKSHQTRQNELRSELQQQYNSEKNLLKENAAVELSHAVESAKQLVELEVQSKTEAQTHEMLQKYRLDSEDRHRKQIERAVEAAEMEFKRNQDIVLDELTTKLNQEWQLRIDENNARWKSLNQQNLDANKVHLTMKFQQEQADALEAQKSVLIAQGDAMVAEVKAEMKQLVGKYEDQIASLKTEHSLHLERECSSLTLKHTLDLETCLKDRDFKEQEAHGLEMETLREELTTSFENQLQRKNDELSSLKNKMDSLITEQQVAMEELRVQLQLKYQEAVQTHANAQDNVVSNLNEEHESEIQELRNKHDDYVESLMLKHDKISRELRNEIKTVREISSQLEETLKDTRAKHAIELERLHEDYAVKANDLSNGKTIEMKEQLQNLADTHNMELTKMSLVLEKAESRHLSQIAQLESNYKNNLEKQTNDMKSTHENALVELRDELSHQYKTSLNAYQVEAQNEKSKLLQEKEECEMKYLKIIEVKKHEIIDLENNVTSLTHQMETNQLEWNEKFNVAMKKNELQLSKELKSQQIDYENQLNLLNLKIEKNKQLHQEECLNIKKKTANAIEKNNQEIIENLKCRHEEELKQANEKYEKRTKENKELIQKLKSELNTMEEKLHHKSKEFENLLEENDKKHSIKILELQDKHANVIRNMMAEFDTTLEKTITSQDINYNNTIHELQKQAKDALELHQYELKECTKQCEMDLNQCRLSYEEDLKQLRERLLHANTMANDKERLHAHEIDELKHEYASNLALARQQQREEIKQLGEQTRADHEKELAAAIEQLKQAMDQQIASEKSKVLKDFEYQLKQKEFAFEQFTEETERQKTALEDRIKLNELTHENEISKIQLDCDSKVTQWKAMNHQLELTIQQNQQQIKDAQDDMDHMKQQHRFQINDMTRTYDSQLQSLKSQHAEAIHKLTAEKDELIKNHTELDSSQKQQIVELKQQNSMKTTENIHLTNSIQSNNALISQMKVDIDQLSEDIVTLNKHTKEKEEEFQNVILPKCLQEERTAVETPLLLKIKELEQTTANTSLDKNKTYSELVDVTNKLNHNEIEMKKLLDRLKKTEEQHVVNINQALARQHEDMKVGYLGLIQQQVETLMQVIVQHSNKMQQEQEKLQAKKGFSMLPPKKGQQLAEANKHMEGK